MITLAKKRRSFVRMFKPRFAPLVEAGTKTQTVRRVPVRMPRAGDQISLRTWTGKPYRSKQRILGAGVITEIAPIMIGCDWIRLHSEFLDWIQQGQFARADGFSSREDFFGYWAREGLPFVGIVISWRTA